MMMICKQCGAETPSEAVYCPKCGERLGNGASNEPKAPAADAGKASSESAKPTTTERVRAATQQPRDYDVEEQLWQGTYSPQAMLGSWLLAGIVTLVLLVLTGLFFAAEPIAWMIVGGLLVVYWLGLALLLAYRRMSVQYELSSQRFVHKSGLLSRQTDRIEVIDMDDVIFQQGLVERLVGVGSIKIISSDRSHPELWLYGIADVARVAELIDDVRRAERRRRGIHIEAI